VTGALVWHESRRVGWAALSAAPAVLAGGTLITLVLASKGNNPAVFVGFWLREVLPLSFGLAVIAVPAAETCLETQLSLRTPVVWTLGRRAGLCTLWSSMASLGLALVAGLTGVWHPAHGLAAGQLTWLSPVLALIGVGAVVFALSGSTTGAGAAVAALWLVQDLTPQWYASRDWARPLYLFIDDQPGPLAAYWWTNRLTLLIVGLLLVGLAAAVLTVRRDRVFAGRLRNLGEDS
jgi:hypothetical protein